MSKVARSTLAAVVLVAGVACDDGSGADDDAPVEDRPGADAAPAADAFRADDRDILTTALTLDLERLEGTAVVELAAGGAGAELEVGDLEILAVELDGTPVPPIVARPGVLGVAAPAAAAVVSVRYRFMAHEMFDGWDPTPGYTLLWPSFCGRLFPCDSRPLDGVRFTLDVTGVPRDRTAVYAREIASESPAYMPAIAIGDYTYTMLGETDAATEVGAYLLPGDPMTGVESLVDYVDWLETLLGPYRFGRRVASVSVEWPSGAYGGMEHHPYWHVARGAIADRNVHAHEAAHGWFGNGVRLACWEDFVLSEGVTSYLAARAIGAAHGTGAEMQEWANYRSELTAVIETSDTIAWPDEPCNSIDILHHPLWSRVPYMKGAFFLRAVEAEVGRDALDGALRRFYETYAGQAARMDDLLDVIQVETGVDPRPLAELWLRSLGAPEDIAGPGKRP